MYFLLTVNLCVDAITEITNNGTMISKDDQPFTSQNTQSKNTLQEIQPTMSYARTTQSTGAVPKEFQTKEKKKIATTDYFWTDQIRKIITFYNNGSRIMIIMRGLPGSGKSYLAKLIVEKLIGPSPSNYKNHVFSSDDYFMVRGKYQYDPAYISYAHAWNQKRVQESAILGVSPIIIDNTNIEIWEMRPYVIDALRNGYFIEVVEPMTPWAKKPKTLFNMNKHKVPLQTLKRMMENYVDNITGDILINSFGLSYPADMVPPIKRLIPVIPLKPAENKTEVPEIKQRKPAEISTSSENVQHEGNNQLLQSQKMLYENSHEQLNNVENSVGDFVLESSAENLLHDQKDDIEFVTMSDFNDLSEEEQAKQKIVLEAQKKLEEMQKFEEDWDNGEKWDENDTLEGEDTFVKLDNAHKTTCTTVTATNSSTDNPKNVTTALISSLKSKPPREKHVKDSNCEIGNNELMQSVTDCQDWRYISMFMPPWNHPDEQQFVAASKEIPKEKIDSSTCVEINDSNLSGNYKIMSTTSRDINEFYVPPVQEKIPERRMLHKSTMTNDGTVVTVQCPQKEGHFIAFRNLFKNIERESLRYIFDNCCGDVNWAVENILGGDAEYKVKCDDGEVSDLEEPDPEPDLPCTCLAKYEIIPNNVSKTDITSSISDEKVTEQATENSVMQLEQDNKKKRVIAVSEENMQLKRQIEQTVVIADSHYSEHCLKLRKIRRGEHYKVDNDSERPSTSGTPNTALESNNRTVSNSDSSDDDDCSSIVSSISESDKIVNINLGRPFIQKLDEMFGRDNMEYPSNINFNISIPTSLLNQINALWIESMMYQLDDNAKKSALMLKQDEEFAR